MQVRHVALLKEAHVSCLVDLHGKAEARSK